DLVPIANWNGRGIARQLLECQARRRALLIGGIGAGELTLESCAAPCRARSDDATLLVACDLGLLSHVRSALRSEIDVLAADGIVLLEHDAVRAVAAVLAGHVGVPGAGGRLELDDGTNILGLGHQSFTPLAISSLTTASIPRASMTLMPLADTVRVTLRRRDGT